MPKLAKLKGFDYRLGREIEQSRADWAVALREVLSQPRGRRRVEHGETFAHLNGVIVFEVYGNLPATKGG